MGENDETLQNGPFTTKLKGFECWKFIKLLIYNGTWKEILRTYAKEWIGGGNNRRMLEYRCNKWLLTTCNEWKIEILGIYCLWNLQLFYVTQMKGSRHLCRPTDPTNKKKNGGRKNRYTKNGERMTQNNKDNLFMKKQRNSRDFMVNFGTQQNFSLVQN